MKPKNKQDDRGVLVLFYGFYMASAGFLYAGVEGLEKNVAGLTQ